MTDDSRQFLLKMTAPPVGSPMDALQLLIMSGAEAGELLAQAYRGERPDAVSVAGYHRRRAYVLVHLAEDHPEFAEAAAEAVTQWDAAEAEATRAAVEGQPAS
ncbi:hypothetical protein [Streptomyces sp. NPDC057199]|uniref:hypothetical protein n=1 Tax=Streptomyces sp. NPDC057199 TaxID=3346047 RepID=UPI00364105EB